jgi:serine protease Do
MFTIHRLFLLIFFSAVTLSDSATAQTLSDRGKRRLPELFIPSVAKAMQSTVQVKSDFKVVALGTIISADGLILTKGSELRGEITVETADGLAFDAEKLAYHKPTDLALLKINATGLTPISFAKESDIKAGHWVAVVGVQPEPLAVGVISAKPRKLYGSEAIIENMNKGYLGIGLMDAEGESGVTIRDVMPGAAAAKAGLQRNDIIRELAGTEIKNRETLLELLESYRPGDVVSIRIKRGDSELSLKVKLGQRSDFSRGDFQNTMGGALSGRRTGFPVVIQHDTVIRPHDCGGPLVDIDGKVLGINIARAGRVETWALPPEVILPVIQELKANKASAVNKR